MKVAAGITRTHNPFDEDYWASCLRENLTSSSYGEGLETDRKHGKAPRQSLTRQLFFKWIKQNLKIKAFYGTSKNAVLIQIWTALIAYLLLVWVKFKTKAGWGLLELTRLAQTMLLERMDLWALLGLRPPDNRQPLLFN